jgi:hypothetical protein
MEARLNHSRIAPTYACIPWPATASRTTAFGATLARARRTARAKRAQGVLASRRRVPLDGPPPEVQRELDAAAHVSQMLAAQGKELRFATSADGRVSVELTDTAGHSLDIIGPSGLFRLLSQQPL